MFRIIVVTLLLVLMISTAHSHTRAYRIAGDLEKYSLLSMVEEYEFAALGTVELLTAQYREDISADGTDTICTDVLFRIETLIKGTPNHGTNHMKFIIRGGRAYHPGIDEVIEISLQPNVTFEVGEKVLLFLSNRRQNAFSGYPYGGWYIPGWDWGKRLVKDGKIYLWYNRGTSHTQPRKNVTRVKMTPDFAKTLALAYMEDKDGAKAIEQTIKNAARAVTNRHLVLTTDQETTMKTRAQAIIDAAKTKETTK